MEISFLILFMVGDGSQVWIKILNFIMQFMDIEFE